MTEVEYGGGGTPHTAKRSRDQLLSMGCPLAPVYKGARERPALEGARQVWGVLLGLPSHSSIPLFLSRVGEKKEGKREGVGKGKGGHAAPFPLVQFGPMGGHASFPLSCLLYSRMAQ